MKTIKIYIKSTLKKYGIFLKWSFMACVTGIVIGFFGTLFHYGIDYGIKLREHNPWILWLLPLVGLLIVFLYRMAKMENDLGTNLVFLSIRSNEKLSLKTAPLIFSCTILTHFAGGSAGREGAALQLGASLSVPFSKLFKLDEHDKKTLTMCGMSAAFAALFGTPITAIVFSMEVLSVGIMYYSALLPCTVAALVGYGMSQLMSVSPPTFALAGIPQVNIKSILLVIVLALGCSLVGILFCISLKTGGKLAKKYFKNPYIRILVGSAIIIALTFLVGTYDYNGAGMPVIERAMAGEARPEAFALKILLTAITLGVGFKGGEIVPVFFTGATFGNAFGDLIGLNPSFSAGIGLSALFCAVTNCPLTSVMLAIEMFGIKGLPLFFVAIAVSYMMSGYYGLYSSQKIMYSKTKSQYIDLNSI